MLKLLRNASFALLAGLMLTACNETDDWHGTFANTEGALIVNQGNQYDGIAGTLGLLDAQTLAYTNDIFQDVNGQSLGDTPQNVIVHGSKIYIPVFGSNRLWVLDKKTHRILRPIDTNQPEWVEGYKNYVYVANNDGFVTRIDTVTWEKTSLAVGPNPAGLTIARGALYVTISDGYNYTNDYVNGKKVVKVNLDGFIVEKEIPCGMNPGKIVSNPSGQIFLVARGNYKSATDPDRVPSIIQYIDASDNIGPSSSLATNGFTNGIDLAASDNYLYVINGGTNSDGVTASFEYKVFNTYGLGLMTDSKFTVGDRPPYPTGIFIDPVTSLVYITSDPGVNGYNQQGSVWIFNYDGTLIHHFNAGIHPFAVAFEHGSVTM